MESNRRFLLTSTKSFTKVVATFKSSADWEEIVSTAVLKWVSRTSEHRFHRWVQMMELLGCWPALELQCSSSRSD